MEFLKFFNITVDIFGIFLCLISIFSCVLNRKIDKNNARYYFYLFLTISLNMLANMLGLIFKGNVNARPILIISNFLEYFFGYLYSYIMTKYLFYYFKVKFKNLNLVLILIYLPSLICLLISQINGMYYYIDQSAFYQRGNLFLLSQIFGFIYLALNFIFFISQIKKAKNTAKITFSIYFTLPVLGLILSIFFYGVYWFLLSTLLSALLMYLVMTYEQVLRFVEEEKKAEEAKYHMVLSQVSPHFLYNSLTSIVSLCDASPKAQEALIKFSKYLRGNLDSLKQKENIPFSKELEHVNIYLYLECLRFDDKIKVEYELNETEFSLPVFSLQIPVENAIKHGITKKEDGGTLKIKTYSSDKFYFLEIIDDGIGFDASDIDTSRDHVGLVNLEKRLKEQANASLDINSVKGKGTKVTITIPKEK